MIVSLMITVLIERLQLAAVPLLDPAHVKREKVLLTCLLTRPSDCLTRNL
jgi:hypothetical protein